MPEWQQTSNKACPVVFRRALRSMCPRRVLAPRRGGSELCSALAHKERSLIHTFCPAAPAKCFWTWLLTMVIKVDITTWVGTLYPQRQQCQSRMPHVLWLSSTRTGWTLQETMVSWHSLITGSFTYVCFPRKLWLRLSAGILWLKLGQEHERPYN